MAKTKKVRDITNLGWDFDYPDRNVNVTPETFGITATPTLQQLQQTVMPLSTVGAQQQLGMAPPSINPATANAPAGMQSTPMTGATSQMPASTWLSPEEQQPVKDYLDDPSSVDAPSPLNTAKSWLANLFDTSDTWSEKEGWKGGDWIGESVWDGLLGSVMWGYDRLNHLSAAAISAAPGGIRTLSWDEASEVSVGQAFAGSMAASAGRAKRGEMQLGDFLMLPGTLTSAALSMIDPNNPAETANFDITDEAQRKAAFSDNAAGKWTSGLLDTAFTIFGDPLILGGKALKVARLTMLDRPITEASRTKIINELDVGRVTITGGDPEQIARLAPPAQFANWVSQKAEDGSKIVTREEIFNHRVIRYATNRDGLTSALYNAENYDEAALILRSAIGDITAQSELMKLRADIAIEIGDAQRRLTLAKYAMNPDTQAQMVKKAKDQADNATKRLNDIVDKYPTKAEAYASNEYKLAKAKLDQANENWIFTESLDQSMIDPLNPLNFTSDTADVARSAVKNMIERDKFFAKAYADEATRIGDSSFGQLQRSTAGFSRDNAFGRFAERSRQSRATAQYQAAATRGARVIDPVTGEVRGGNFLTKGAKLHFWETDVFGNNGLTRTLRLWRWMGEETPSGFVTTRSIGAQESTREVRAMINDVPIFSGEARTVTIRKQKIAKKGANKGKYVDVLDSNGKPVMQTVTVGGVENKERLIGMYMDALQDSTRGDMAAKHALDRLEFEMTKQISAWHGLDMRTATDVLTTAQSKRDKIVESIKREGYWVDEDGTINKSPWLETQLQQGTYTLNWKAFEKRTRLYEETGWAKKGDTAMQFSSDKLKNGYEFFNELWRPAVLMRLGYTQRNVTEGLMRSTAFQFSLSPIKYAAWQGAYATRNAWVKNISTRNSVIQRTEQAMLEARKTGATVAYPKKFIKWKATQVAVAEEQVANNIIAYMEVAKTIAPMSKEAKDMAVDFAQRQIKTASDEVTALKNSNAASDLVKIAEDKVKFLNDQLDEVKQITPTSAGGAKFEIDTAIGQLRFFDEMDEFYRGQRAILDGDLEAVALFKQQGKAKRRVFDGSFSGPDHRTYQQAFSQDSPYTPVALMNLSADNTQKAMASLYMDSMDNALRAVSRKYNVRVDPSMGDEYFEGVAISIRQFANSEVGRMVIDRKNPDEIIDFLLKTPEGREIGAFVSNATVKQKGAANLPAPMDRDSAGEYVAGLISRWESMAPSPELRDYVAKMRNLGTEANAGGWNGDVVKTFLNVTDANGNKIYTLKPIIGNIAQETGFKTVRQQWAKIANTGMKWLGTLPEDAFVRAPFYGRQYEETLKELIDTVQSQTPGDFIPVAEVAKLQRIAHRRALKNTKDWLYTIDRRTRLGNVGEYMFPFISAAQNSVTTAGRLIWNDPSIVGVAMLLWSAPDRMGIVDENGDIVIPIPHQFIPDGIEERLGLDNMMNWKISKNSLNVFMPETGFGIIPRPGPIVVVPVNEFMKRSIMISPESPNIMRTMFGKDAADTIWNITKDYIFGEEGRIVPDAADIVLPPWMAKIKQFAQGEGSSTQYAYYYNLQYRTEMAKYAAGYRDTVPSKEELQSRTDGLYFLRFLANVAAFTPPQYESKMDPLVNAVRLYDEAYGPDSNRMLNENFGNILLMLGDWSNSKNVAGMPAYASSVEAARKYANIITDIAPSLSDSGNLSVLSMLVNDDPNAFYDGTAYGWQLSNQIPGVSDFFREMQTPEEAMIQAQKNAGWTEYISRMDYLDSLLQQRGLTSYRSADATDLREMKNQTLANLRDNPMYAGWYQDYETFGSTRTEGALRLMQRALSDEQFVADQADSEIWQAAYQYLQARAITMDMLANAQGGINAEGNEYIREFWDNRRQELINKYDGWGTFSNRFLNGDEDPQNLGVQFGVVYDVGSEGDVYGYPAA